MPSTLIPQRRLDTDDAASRPRPSDSQKNRNKATSLGLDSVPTSSKAIKRTTANSNDVIVTRTSAVAAPKVKSKSKQVLNSEVPLDDGMHEEDDSQEQEAALASPMKGSESRKLNKVCYILSLM